MDGPKKSMGVPSSPPPARPPPNPQLQPLPPINSGVGGGGLGAPPPMSSKLPPHLMKLPPQVAKPPPISSGGAVPPPRQPPTNNYNIPTSALPPPPPLSNVQHQLPQPLPPIIKKQPAPTLQTGTPATTSGGNLIPNKPPPPRPNSTGGVGVPPVNGAPLPQPPRPNSSGNSIPIPTSSLPPPPPLASINNNNNNNYPLPPPPPPPEELALPPPPPMAHPQPVHARGGGGDHGLPAHLASLPPTILPPPPSLSPPPMLPVTPSPSSSSNSIPPPLATPPPPLTAPKPQLPTHQSKESLSEFVNPSSQFRNSTDALAPPLSDFPEITSQARIAEENFNYLKDIYNKITKRSQSSVSCVREGNSLAEAFKNYGTMLIAQSDNNLGQCMFKIGDFQRDYESFRNKVDNQALSGLRGTVDQYINRDMKVVRANKKNYDKIRSMYDSVDAKVASNASKGKGVNLVKQAELQQERDFLRQRVSTVGSESDSTIRLATESNAVELMEQIVEYVENVQLAVLELNKHIESIQPSIQLYKKESQRRRQELENKIEIQKSQQQQQQQQQQVNIFSADTTPIPSSSSNPKSMSTTPNKIGVPKAERDVPGEDPRKSRIRRLVSSERSYVHSLSQLVSVYLVGLRTDDRLFSKVFKEDEIAIFSNIEPLLAHQSKFLEEIDNHCLKQFGEPGALGLAAAFARASPKFVSLYSTYINNFNRALVTINRCKQSKNFQSYLKTCEEKADGSDLNSLISLPLSRLPNYLILLQELKESFTSNQPGQDPNEHNNIMVAIEKIQSLCDLVGQSQNVIQLMKIEQSLIGYDSTLLEEGRFLVKEGTVGITIGNMPPSNYYFILLSDILIYCKKHNALFPVSITSDVMSLVPLPNSASSSRYKYVGRFELKSMDIKSRDDTSILASSGPNNTITYCFESKQQKEEWWAALNKYIAKANQNKLFSIALENLYQRPTEVGRPIPSFLQRIVDYLFEHGYNEEGIFRLSANQRVLDNSKEEIETGIELDYFELDTHVVACLLKLWVRNLPEPLLTWKAFDAFVAVADIDSKQQRYQTIKQLVDRLPLENRFCVYYLMRLLTKVADNSATNKMTPNNISIVFATLLLKKKDASPLDCTSFNTIFGVIECFMTGFTYIFSDVEKQFNEYNEQQLHLKRKSVMMMKPLPQAPGSSPASAGVPDMAMLNKQPPSRPTSLGTYATAKPSIPSSSMIGSDSEGEEEDDDEGGFSFGSNISKQASITIQLGEIVKQGYLTKKGAMRRNWTKRWFVLKQNYLFYFKSSRDKKPKGIIQLVNVGVVKSFYKPNCMAIKSLVDKDEREFLICATSANELEEWIKAITNCSSKE